MSVPTRGDTFAKLLEHLRLAQEDAAMLAHLHNTEGNDMDKLLAKGWLGVSELLKRQCHVITQQAMKGFQ